MIKKQSKKIEKIKQKKKKKKKYENASQSEDWKEEAFSAGPFE